MEAVQFLRKALKQNPEDILIAHTLAMVLSGVPDQSPDSVSELLDELNVALENPLVNHLIIVECGMALWLKFFERQDIQAALQREEIMNLTLPPHQAYLNGLKDGAFSILCLQPFFMQAISKVLII